MARVLRKYVSAAAEASHAAVASGDGRLKFLTAGNKNAATAYLWVFDSLTAAGAALMTPIPLTSNGFESIGLPRDGIPYSTGLSIALSSTFLTFTQLGTADGHFTVGYLGT